MMSQPATTIQPPATAAPKNAEPRQRIVYFTAGAATRFCGSCLHDNGLAKTIAELGEEILLVPTMPHCYRSGRRLPEPGIFRRRERLFAATFRIFRHTPWLMDRWLDSPRLLNWLAQRSAGMEVAKPAH